MSEQESIPSISPGEATRLIASARLAEIENGTDQVAASIATHLNEIMHDGNNRMCFRDSRKLAELILNDPKLKDTKVCYWFLMQDSPALTEEELREEYEFLQLIMN